MLLRNSSRSPSRSPSPSPSPLPSHSHSPTRRPSPPYHYHHTSHQQQHHHHPGLRILPYKAFELNAHRGTLSRANLAHAARMLVGGENETNERVRMLAERFALNDDAVTLVEFRKIALHLELGNDAEEEIEICWAKIDKLQRENDVLWQQLLEPSHANGPALYRAAMSYSHSPPRRPRSAGSPSERRPVRASAEPLAEQLELERARHAEELAALHERLDGLRSEMARAQSQTIQLGKLNDSPEASLRGMRVPSSAGEGRGGAGRAVTRHGQSLAAFVGSLGVDELVTEALAPLAPGGVASLRGGEHPSESVLRKHLERAGLKGLHGLVWQGISALRDHVNLVRGGSPSSCQGSPAMVPLPLRAKHAAGGLGASPPSVHQQAACGAPGFEGAQATYLGGMRLSPTPSHARIERERAAARRSAVEVASCAREVRQRREAARERQAAAEAARRRAREKRHEADTLRNELLRRSA